MSTQLKDYLKEKAVLFKAEQDRLDAIKEWQTAVGRLYDRLEHWLRAADPDGHIRHERYSRDVTEPGLGRYQVDCLGLKIFEQWMGFIPKARKTIKSASPRQEAAPERATGRVDLTNEVRRYVLYRFGQGPDEEWFVDDPTTADGLQPLTPERFEAAVLSYLK